MPKPNILYIHSHDTGRFAQPYGHAVSTPNIQKLAKEGVLFRRAFSGAPTCSPSRACLVTGQAAHSSGMLGLAHRGFGLNDYSQHILHTLKKAGYRTALSGVQHVALRGDRSLLGYDEDLFTQKGAGRVEAVEEFLKRQTDGVPFFLTVGFNDTHREFPEPGPEDDERYTVPPAPLPDTPETRRDMAAFKASARRLDRDMGRVFDLLKEYGFRDNTLVICTTDHGLAFPRMKCTLHDTGIGVMQVMRWPDGADFGFTEGRVVDALTSHIDLFPTICDIVGIEHPDWLEGKSLLPVLRGETEEVNGEIFAEVTFHASYEPQRCVRTHRWKYIRRWGDREEPVLPNCDQSPSKQLWMDHGWQDSILPREALYDLMFDPNETNNLAGDPRVADELNNMRTRLEKWMERTNDPLLKGYVDPPKGAALNDPAGFSPQEEPFIVE